MSEIRVTKNIEDFPGCETRFLEIFIGIITVIISEELKSRFSSLSSLLSPSILQSDNSREFATRVIQARVKVMAWSDYH